MYRLRYLIAGGALVAATVLGTPTAVAQTDSHAQQCSSLGAQSFRVGTSTVAKCQENGDASLVVSPGAGGGPGFSGGFYPGPYLTPYW